jgi:ABC-type nitrate/sulfonate/bicarbonate transport system substrate-binding protein
MFKVVVCTLLLLTLPILTHAAEKIRAAFPSLATALSPSWIAAESGVWKKYGFDVELIYLDGGTRSVSALVGGSTQFVFGSDILVTTANLQGANLLRLGVTTNTLGYALVASPGVQTVKDLKGKILGITMGRDAAYARLTRILSDNGVDPKNDVTLLPIGGGPSGRVAALQAGRIHGTMLTPPTDLHAERAGMKVLLRMDVPSIAGGVTVAGSLAQKSRPLVLNFLKGYMEGIHYLKSNKAGSLKVFAKYLRSSDAKTLAYLYDEIAGRVEKDLRPQPESVRFLLDLVAQDRPKAERLSESDHWDLSYIEEIKRSGFVDKLYAQ